jgi:hypothetical protein
MFKHIDMETLSRREREIQELRSSIIDQSWKIIIEEGWQALSIRKIADAIDLQALRKQGSYFGTFFTRRF